MELVRGQVATAIVNAVAYEQERMKAEALSEVGVYLFRWCGEMGENAVELIILVSKYIRSIERRQHSSATFLTVIMTVYNF